MYKDGNFNMAYKEGQAMNHLKSTKQNDNFLDLLSKMNNKEISLHFNTVEES